MPWVVVPMTWLTMKVPFASDPDASVVTVVKSS
jgi:hypothetical protein